MNNILTLGYSVAAIGVIGYAYPIIGLLGILYLISEAV